jgi:hypothetical protein
VLQAGRSRVRDPMIQFNLDTKQEIICETWPRAVTGQHDTCLETECQRRYLGQCICDLTVRRNLCNVMILASRGQWIGRGIRMGIQEMEAEFLGESSCRTFNEDWL